MMAQYTLLYYISVSALHPNAKPSLYITKFYFPNSIIMAFVGVVMIGSEFRLYLSDQLQFVSIRNSNSDPNPVTPS